MRSHPGVSASFFAALAEAFSLDPAKQLADLSEKVFRIAGEQSDAVALRYAARRLDERLKRVASAAKDLATL